MHTVKIGGRVFVETVSVYEAIEWRELLEHFMSQGRRPIEPVTIEFAG